MTVSTPIWGKLADLFDRKLLVQTALVAVRVRLDPRRLRAVHELADRLPRDPGPRRRRPDGADPGRAVRPGLPARARALHGLPRLGVGRRHGRRPAARRRDHRLRARLALVLLRRRARSPSPRSSCCSARCTCPSAPGARCGSTTSAPTLISAGVSALLIWVSLAGQQFDWAVVADRPRWWLLGVGAAGRRRARRASRATSRSSPSTSSASARRCWPSSPASPSASRCSARPSSSASTCRSRAARARPPRGC